MTHPKWTDLLHQNQVYSEEKHCAKATIGKEGFELPSVFIFSCIDFRASAEELLDMHSEDAFVVRNLGGRVKNSLNALLFVEEFTKGQALKDVIIIHHTDCGCTHNSEEGLRDGLKAKNPEQALEIDQLEFGTYDGSSLEKHKIAVRQDMELLKSSSLIREELKDRVYGYIYDIKSGRLIAVPYVVIPYDG
ncbi:carbonic anhydrase [Thozetella sp. PMI_491]|nr:carbonic anhydrase [Thozetella sp. PMI_491]